MQKQENVNIVVEGISFLIAKSVLLQQIQNDACIQNQKSIYLPNWVTARIYLLVEKYLKHEGNISILEEHKHDATTLIQILRLSDYLSLCKLQEKLINQLIVHNLNHQNCIQYLEETHKKLRNIDNGLQCWFNLLNHSINYLSIHIKAIYALDADKIRKLHQKIINQVLDRAIRFHQTQSHSSQSSDQHFLFQLIIQSKKNHTVDALCHTLRTSLLAKKINPKIHAKLSWKLQELLTLNEKKTKLFKFLDMQWYLEAERNKASNTIQIKLNLCPSIEEQKLKKQIGVFYVKLIWVIQPEKQKQQEKGIETKKDTESESDKREQKLCINYLQMYQKEKLEILELTSQTQKAIGNKKIQLSIYCSMEQVYSFVMNYVVQNHQKIMIDEKKMQPGQLIAIIKILKHQQYWSQALRFMKYLSTIQKDIPKDLVEGYPIKQLTSYEVDFLNKINLQKILPSDILEEHPVSETGFSISSRISKNTISVERKTEERQESRGRIRKIFAASPTKQIDEKTQRREQILRVTSFKNYLIDGSNAVGKQLI